MNLLLSVTRPQGLCTLCGRAHAGANKSTGMHGQRNGMFQASTYQSCAHLLPL